MHSPSQATDMALQVTLQMPSAQTSPETQGASQSPQCCSSVLESTHWSPHRLNGDGQSSLPVALDATVELDIPVELAELAPPPPAPSVSEGAEPHPAAHAAASE
jgi:hypothetical protein